MKETTHYKTQRGHALLMFSGITVLAFLMLVSVAGAAPFAYITNYDDNTVSVIDISSNTVTATVPVGLGPFGVAFTPDGSKVYVTNNKSNNVSVIDTSNSTVIDTVSVGSWPRGIVVSPDGTKAYVTNYLSSNISIIDTATNTVTDTVDVGNGSYGVAVNSDGTKVYVTNWIDDTVSVINASNNTVIDTVSVGSWPRGIVVSPDGSKVYVANEDSNTASVIDTATNKIITTVPVGDEPVGVAINLNGTKVYVANEFSGNVSIIDTATDTVTTSIYGLEFPYGIAVTPDGTKIYVTNYWDNTTSVINTSNNTVTAIVPVGKTPVAFGQFIGGHKLYGINFSPYMDGQNPDYGSKVDREQVIERLTIIAPYTIWIRTYGTENGLEYIGPAAREMGLKTAIGAWLSEDSEANEIQIKELINETNAEYVDLAIVGSETLLRNDLSEDQLINYIRRVKQEAHGINVTTADTYGELLNHPRVMAECDVIMYNSYPYWEGINIDNAIASQDNHYKSLVNQVGNKSVIVSETGWPSEGNTIGSAVPSPENSARYFKDFVSWAHTNDIQYFYFEAFDETWKASIEGPQGAHWGIWDKDGFMKSGMEMVFNNIENSTEVPPQIITPVIPGKPRYPGINITYVPPYGTSGSVSGTVEGVNPSDCKVAVYIYVSGWWNKPYWDSSLIGIGSDGTWSCDIDTGGDDVKATHVTAFLVPSAYVPPKMAGEKSLPSELYENSIASITVER